jgi:Raf kinase inhibitor-like YbhB/YbcL family protein
MPLTLASPAIPPSGEIPAQYTCDGADISPPLSWSDLPPGTGSLVLVVEDPDAPSGTFRHWAVFDIPPASRGLDAGYSANRPTTALHEAPQRLWQNRLRAVPVHPEGPARITITSAGWRSAARHSI